jgi:hypothetical protein
MSMVVPLAARCVAAVFGVVLVVASWASIIETLVVPRPIGSLLTRTVDKVVLPIYRLIIVNTTDRRRRDRVLASEAAAILLTQLVGWLASVIVGFALMLWPLSPTPDRRCSLSDSAIQVETGPRSSPSSPPPLAW